MSSEFPDVAGDRRELRLSLREDAASTATSLALAQPRRWLELRTAFDDVEVTTEGVGGCHLEAGVVRLLDLRAGARVVVRGRASYGAAPHGLWRWTDPADGRPYVVGSGALDGAARFMAAGAEPSDRMRTTVIVEAEGTVRTFRPGSTVASASAASHHLGLAAGDWQRTSAPGVELLSRWSLDSQALVDGLMADTRAAVDWLVDWFGASVKVPWGSTYTQVLLPRAPWAAMEHSGCVLVSEQLLHADRARRVTVLAHEAAHQWLGNLVSPQDWADVGIFEGLAELLGQLACEAVVGPEAATYVQRRRAAGPLFRPGTGPDLRTFALTAGLPEIAGPVQHAELIREARSELGDAPFQERLRDLVARRQGTSCASVDVWEALGCGPRSPRRVPLPTLGIVGERPPRRDALIGTDPTTAARNAREAFRRCPAGPQRVMSALIAISDPATLSPVVAGLGAELVRNNAHHFGPLV